MARVTDRGAAPGRSRDRRSGDDRQPCRDPRHAFSRGLASATTIPVSTTSRGFRQSGHCRPHGPWTHPIRLTSREPTTTWPRDCRMSWGRASSIVGSARTRWLRASPGRDCCPISRGAWSLWTRLSRTEPRTAFLMSSRRSRAGHRRRLAPSPNGKSRLRDDPPESHPCTDRTYLPGPGIAFAIAEYLPAVMVERDDQIRYRPASAMLKSSNSTSALHPARPARAGVDPTLSFERRVIIARSGPRCA